jgi:methionyl-tRNA formyltransferase
MKNFTAVIFGYGFMAQSSHHSMSKEKRFRVKGLILPDKRSVHYSTNIKKNLNIKTLYSENLKKIFLFIKKINPDVVIISTFNKILSNKILKLSKFINVHHGKLPQQKGRASINWAIIMGRNQIYITIHEATAALDSGRIIYQKKIIIKKYDNYSTIKKKVNLFLKNNLSKIILKFLEKKIKLKNNNKNKATWNCGRNPEDGMINFYKSRNNVINLIRGTNDKNFGAYCFLEDKKITILEARINSKKKYEGLIPGRIVKIHKNGNVDCLCADGEIRITSIIYKNKLLKPSKIINSTKYTLLND